MKTTQLLLATLFATLACMTGCDMAKVNKHQFFNAGDVIVAPDGTRTVSIRRSVGPSDQYEELAPHATFPVPEDLSYQDVDYRIGPGDVINIRVYDLYFEGAETAVQKVVSETGQIDMPLLDDQIKAAGLTQQELRREIIQRYDDKGILRKDRASVQVEMAVKRKAIYSILGAVVRPGAYSVSRPDMRLLEALAIGGGVSQSSIKYIYVIRHGSAQPSKANGKAPVVPPTNGQENGDDNDGFDKLRQPLRAQAVMRLSENDNPIAENDPEDLRGKNWKPGMQGWTRSDDKDQAADPTPEAITQQPIKENDDPFKFAQSLGSAAQSRVIAINLQKLRLGDAMMNIVIRDGDVIQIKPLEVAFFYVAGHVNRPGVYELTGRAMTLKQAITAAGMYDPVAWPENTILIRRIGDNQEQYIRLDMEKIWKGTEQDVFVRKDDTIAVGTNWRASFMAVIRNSFRMTYGFGFIYDRNFADPLDRAKFGYDSSRFTRW